MKSRGQKEHTVFIMYTLERTETSSEHSEQSRQPQNFAKRFESRPMMARWFRAETPTRVTGNRKEVIDMENEKKIDRAKLIGSMMQKIIGMSDVEMLVAQGFIDGFAARGAMEGSKEVATA